MAGESCGLHDSGDGYPFNWERSDLLTPANPFGVCRNSAGECARRPSGEQACVMDIGNCRYRCDSDAECTGITVGTSKTDADGNIYNSSTWSRVRNSSFCSAGDRGYCMPVL